jgi:5-methylcytosine-specific restriction protein B
MILNEQITTRIRAQYDKLAETGEVLPEEQLTGYYLTFREKFGPERLASLDGEALLNLMHDSSNRDSLVYWLEFKNDEEFPYRFGSIAGGSALKFGIYRRKETGGWMSGSPQKQIPLTTEQAIEMARRNREQLLKGVRLLEALPLPASDEQYAELQRQLDEQAQDVSNTSWGHKYFSLLFPDKLDDYHNPYYQRFHLLKMLQMPVADTGRYAVAGQYMAIARELEMHVNNLTRVLNEIDGEPHQYWLVKTRFVEDQNRWDDMLAASYIGIGWHQIGDLSFVQRNEESLNQIKALMLKHYNERGGFAREIFTFVAKMNPGDVVLAAERKQGNDSILGIGRVTGGYTYQPDYISNRRAVEWLNTTPFELPISESNNRTVRELVKYQNILAIEQYLLNSQASPTRLAASQGKKTTLTGLPARIHDILERKRQVILYGPPGTGKTHWAYQAANQIAAHQMFGQDYDSLSAEQQAEITGAEQKPGLVRFCTFHPSYGYEDFIEGYKPENANGNLSFGLQPGIFKRLCQAARAHPQQKHLLIIDEINRGDIPRIFGELITLLEKNKRGWRLPLPVSGEPFSVPDNVYIIGTMNTADRSIALLDTALRRRFGFIELMPDSSVLGAASLDGIPLGAWLDALNQRILQSVGRDARNLQIGHAYLLENGRPLNDFSHFARILQEDILPLLEEYCYEDYDALEKILGRSLVDRQNQRIRHELFEPSRKEELIQALLSPEITTSSAAAKTDQSLASDGDENEDQS